MKKGQRGFTLTETLISVSISVLVGLAITVAIYQIINNTEHNTNHMSAVLQLEQADQFISKDASKAQIIETENLSSSDLLRLTWIDGNNGDEYSVTYILEGAPGSTLRTLQRNQSINGSDNQSTFVSNYIESDPAKTNCQYDDGVLTLTITATVGGDVTEQSETRTYKVVARSS